jgi:hypothetical protein
MINYQVHEYKCGCKQVFIKDPAKRLIKDYRKCLEHNVFKSHIITWCEKCGKRLIVVPLAGNRKYCLGCAVYKEKKTTIRSKQKREGKESTGEALQEKEEREFRVWFNELRDRFKPPIMEAVK